MKAVIDRFEEGYAVLLVGDEETELVVPQKLLPREAKEGTWLNITLEIDSGETEKRRKRVEDKLKKLKEKNR